jgi:hypothetical protein
MFALTTVNTLGGTRTPYSAQILADQPTKYLKLNETANPVIDYSLYNRGASFSGTNFVFNHKREMHAETGGGLVFMPDAVSPHERLVFTHKLSESPSFSIECWFNKYYITTNNALIGTTYATPSYSWAINLTTNATSSPVIVMAYGNTRNTIANYKLGYIYHLVCTFSGDTAKSYVNGALVNTYVNANVSTLIQNINLTRTNNSWNLGHGVNVSSNALAILSNFATYDYELAGEQVLRHYQLGYQWQPHETTLLSWYKEDINASLFDNNTSCGKWTNIANNQDTLHFTTISLNMLCGFDTPSFYLTGATGRYLATTAATLPATSNFYIAFVIQVTNDAVSSIESVFNQYSAGTVGRTFISVRSATGGYVYHVFVGGNGSTIPILDLSSTVFSGSANRIVFIERVGNTINIYVNNVFNATTTYPTTLSIQQFRNVLGATDVSSSANFSSMTWSMINCRLRELIIGTDLTQRTNIASYLAREYQISLS